MTKQNGRDCKWQYKRYWLRRVCKNVNGALNIKWNHFWFCGRNYHIFFISSAAIMGKRHGYVTANKSNVDGYITSIAMSLLHNGNGSYEPGNCYRDNYICTPSSWSNHCLPRHQGLPYPPGLDIDQTLSYPIDVWLMSTWGLCYKSYCLKIQSHCYLSISATNTCIGQC